MTATSLVGAVLAVMLGTYHWRRRASNALSGPLALAMFCGAWWAVMQAVVVWGAWEPARVAAAYAILPGLAVLVACTVVFVLVLAGLERRVTRRLLILLAIHPVAILLAIAADPWLRLVFSAIGEDAAGRFVMEFGPVFWIHSTYSYGLTLMSAALLVRALLRSVRGHRAVLAIALAALLLPSFGNTLMLIAAERGQVDLGPLLFLITAGLWSWVAVYRARLGVVPVSTRDVLAALSDGVVVVDAAGVVIDANPRGHELLSRLRPRGAAVSAVLGRPWEQLVDDRYLRLLADGDQHLLVLDDRTVLDLRLERMRSAEGRSRGAVVVARDVTELERLREELAELAVRDSLTGLFNRRYLGPSLEAGVAAADATATPLSVVMLDVDRFKQVNDTHGHAVGDAVLEQLARILAAGIRDGDVVARSGGEEFILVLPGATKKQAAVRAEELRARCSTHEFATEAGPLHVTVSLGVAEHRPGVTADGLLIDADRSLYRAKAGGRDRVAV
ncbi:histidine kinase N-terminal 7TM domain-containing diguanylate cyclase [Demequina muriae]|uniref:Diguanylate cyclase n=1 Tax=Demequina muriae TaxID=3051664 RepID=A0ABT8GET4_9MICO|nr:diguanylate cyclase [Demequina sp. EGI L300058]MDN4479943.1 diguanylate cyclase [Demequina sp. EGI L300058]